MSIAAYIEEYCQATETDFSCLLAPKTIPEYARRNALVISLAFHGYNYKQISDILNVDFDTILKIMAANKAHDGAAAQTIRPKNAPKTDSAA